jgi:hypothetical protein
METPAEPMGRADPSLDWEDDAHHRPVTRMPMLACERWALGLLGALLVGCIGLLGWTWSSLSAVTVELGQLRAQLDQLESGPQRTGGEAVRRRPHSGCTRWTSACPRWRAGPRTPRRG